VRGLAGSLGLEIVALQPFRDFKGLPEPARSKAAERARRKFELMGRLATPLLLVCSSILPEAIDDMSRVAADLHELVSSPASSREGRLRGARLGPSHQRLPPGLGGGAARRP
jgi:4-hydroxyphenylpyruvate dioxygenase